MQAQLDSPGMPPYRFVDGIDGRSLAERERNAVYDETASLRRFRHPMSAPEIGCAASHLAAYRLVVDEKLPCAVVLEDDALLGHLFPAVLKRLAAMVNCSRPQAILLSHVFRYSAWGGMRVGKLHRLYRPYEVYGAHAYLVTQAGAVAMLRAFPRVSTVADDWRYFQRTVPLEVRALVPYVVGTSAFCGDSQMGTERDLRERETKAEESALWAWTKRYVWRRFMFQLLAKPLLRLHRVDQSW